MLKKLRKESDLKFYVPMEKLEGPVFAYGRVGSGKTVSLMGLMQTYHDEFGYTGWDIFGGNRHESEYWGIPSDADKEWAKLARLGKLNEPGGKQYDLLYMFPYFQSMFPDRLPSKTPFVQSLPITFALKDARIDDIEMITGSLAETSKYVWNEILHRATKKTTSADLLDIAADLKAENTTIYKSFLVPMSREHFLMDSYCDTNFDIKTEAKNKSRIKVLVLKFVPKEFRLFVINWFLRRLVNLLDDGVIPKKNILLVREASVFFRATENSVLPENLKLFRTNFAEYIKEGRRGMYFFLDCQSSVETRGIVQGQEDMLLLFRMTSWRDKADLCDELKRERRMRADQVADLARLDKGECYVVESGKNVKKVKFMVPRTMFWKKERGNFYKSVWENYGGQWINAKGQIEYIEERCKQNQSAPSSATTKPAEQASPTVAPTVSPIEPLKDEVPVKKSKSINELMLEAYE